MHFASENTKDSRVDSREQVLLCSAISNGMVGMLCIVLLRRVRAASKTLTNF